MKFAKSAILSIWLLAAIFAGCFSANRLAKYIDERTTVEKSARRSFFRYKISTLREASLEHELNLAKFGLFKMWDGSMVAEEDEAMRKRLTTLLDVCKANRSFFNSPNEDTNDQRKRMFIRGCWLYYKREGVIFDETKYGDVRWENHLDGFAEDGIVGDEYIRKQYW